MSTLRERIEALPVHSISGYEWECYGTGCHYHWRIDGPGPCKQCGQPISGEGEHDRDGRPCEHDALLDRAAVLALLGEA